MQKGASVSSNKIIGVLGVLLILSLGASAYLFIDRVIYRYYSEWNDKRRIRMMNAYDRLLCDMICGKTINEANEIIAPHEVVRFKKRRDLAHLYIEKDRVQICLDGDIILAVESSSYVHESPDCLNNINLFDGTSQGQPTATEE